MECRTRMTPRWMAVGARLGYRVCHRQLLGRRGSSGLARIDAGEVVSHEA